MTEDAPGYVAITRLQAAYADVVTRRAWPELEELFFARAPIHIDRVTGPVIQLSGPRELGQFVDKAIMRFDFFEFVNLNTVVHFDSDAEASGRLYMVEVRQDRESGEWSNAFGLYRDRYALVGGQWRFAARDYRSMARKAGAAPASVFPLPP